MEKQAGSTILASNYKEQVAFLTGLFASFLSVSQNDKNSISNKYHS